MAAVSKIDANVTGLRFEEESSLGTLPGSPVWKPLEPNSYSDFGQQLTAVARTPITDTRQRKKGVSTDLDASGGFNMDLTQENAPQLASGYFFAAIRTKDEITGVAVVDGTGDDFEPTAGGDDYVAGDLLFASGFADAANNGLHLVTGAPSATSIPVTSSLVTAAAQDGTLRRVGFQFASGDAQIDASGTLPKLTSTIKDMTAFGLIPGEWIYLGADASPFIFALDANRGFARVLSVSANEIILDKTEGTLATDTAVGRTVRVFMAPRVLKNESTPSLIVRKSFQFERTLGAPDSALPSQIQSEYLIGAVPSTLQLNVATADKMTADLAFMGTDMEQRTGAVGVKSGTRPAVVESDAFNTSSDVSRFKMSLVDTADSAPAPLFAFVQEATITVDNNLTPNKAVANFGAFDISSGNFAVSGSMTAYFADVAAMSAVRNNSDVTMDMHVVKSNAGITIDLPLVSLADGRPNVEADAPITLPVTFDAASGAKVNAALDHTMLVQWWSYLPDYADA